jgi:hypothetical protein
MQGTHRQNGDFFDSIDPKATCAGPVKIISLKSHLQPPLC